MEKLKKLCVELTQENIDNFKSKHYANGNEKKVGDLVLYVMLIEDDSKDFLPAQNELDVVVLIEDEIILDLPSAPRHDCCALPETGQGSGVVSPFSVLKNFTDKV